MPEKMQKHTYHIVISYSQNSQRGLSRQLYKWMPSSWQTIFKLSICENHSRKHPASVTVMFSVIWRPGTTFLANSVVDCPLFSWHKGEGNMANSLTFLPKDMIIWTETTANWVTFNVLSSDFYCLHICDCFKRPAIEECNLKKNSIKLKWILFFITNLLTFMGNPGPIFCKAFMLHK